MFLSSSSSSDLFSIDCLLLLGKNLVNMFRQRSTHIIVVFNNNDPHRLTDLMLDHQGVTGYHYLKGLAAWSCCRK